MTQHISSSYILMRLKISSNNEVAIIILKNNNNNNTNNIVNIILSLCIIYFNNYIHYCNF
jgi:hypothetical protein